MQVETEVSELFHENTKITPYDNGDDLSKFPKRLEPGVVLSRVHLPKFTVGVESMGLEEAIEKRVTSRSFNPWMPMPLTTLSRLLSFCCGYTTSTSFEGAPQVEFRRAAPSAGATYPIEVYPVVLRVAGLTPGVYRYAMNDHSLELLRPGNFARALAAWTLHQPYIGQTSVVLVLAGFSDRLSTRYGERGYRYMLLESGHIAQNVYLLGTAYGLGVLSNGGFVDAAINRLVGLNEISENALYIAAVGVLQ